MATAKKSTAKKVTQKAAEKAATKSPAKTLSSAKAKTASVVGKAGPEAYLASLPEPRKTEVGVLDALIREVLPGLAVGMYGKEMVGYGPFHYRYATGREGDAYRIALSSRAQYISLYCLGADDKGYVAEQFKKRLPKASIGKSCVRFKKLADVDLGAIRDLLLATVKVGYSGA